MERQLEKASVALLLLVGIGYVILPKQVGALLSPGISMLADAVIWANANFPRPVFLILIFLATTIISVLIAISFARVFYRLLSNAGPRVTFVYRKLTPGTPIGKIAFAFGLMILFLIGSVWAMPYVIGDLNENSTVAGADDIVNESNEVALVTELEGDTIPAGPGGAGAPEYEGPPYQRPTPDTDGDRLKDSWERRGQLPNGVQIPDANPQRMDLYVQFNYGGGTVPLSDREKEQLRQYWAEMPVENPDGSEGITLHIVDSRPRGGPIGEQVSISGSSSEEIFQYYTARYMGQRRCQYHQVVFGEIQRGSVVGVANTPGFAAVVDGQRSAYDGNMTVRTWVITHELLHNVAGEVGDDGHVERGWLAPSVSAQDTFLSDTTARQLNENGLAGSGYYQQELCGDTGTTTGTQTASGN
jgi:hypothetical protein